MGGYFLFKSLTFILGYDIIKKPILQIFFSLSTERFGEGLRIAQDNLNANNFYAFNPEFDSTIYR